MGVMKFKFRNYRVLGRTFRMNLLRFQKLSLIDVRLIIQTMRSCMQRAYLFFSDIGPSPPKLHVLYALGLDYSVISTGLLVVLG
jgi:hypothetical protein